VQLEKGHQIGLFALVEVRQCEGQGAHENEVEEQEDVGDGRREVAHQFTLRQGPDVSHV
jgi:hypothetical protein